MKHARRTVTLAAAALMVVGGTVTMLSATNDCSAGLTGYCAADNSSSAPWLAWDVNRDGVSFVVGTAQVTLDWRQPPPVATWHEPRPDPVRCANHLSALPCLQHG